MPRGSSLCEGMGEGCCTQPYPCICKVELDKKNYFQEILLVEISSLFWWHNASCNTRESPTNPSLGNTSINLKSGPQVTNTFVETSLFLLQYLGLLSGETVTEICVP